MLNYIWFGILIIGLAFGIITGKVDEVTGAVVRSAESAVELSIGLLGIICLWNGLMEIAEKSGAVNFISRLLRPLLSFLYPGIPKGHPAMGSIVMNLAANFMGLGNAATPLGIRAMNDMQKINDKKDTATDSMSMFLVMNTAAIQLIPATIIALRSARGSSNPAGVTVTIWASSIIATIAGIIAVRTFSTRAHKSSGGRKWKR